MQPFIDRDFDLVSAQVQYSLLDARPAGAFTRWCEQNDVRILCYGVLAGGFLTDHWLGKPDPGFEFQNRSLIKYRLIIEDFGGWDLFQSLLLTLNGIGQEYGVPLSSIAARYMMDQPQVAAVIIGARTAANIDTTLASFDVTLSEADLSAIEAVTGRRKGPAGSVYELERDRNGPHGRIMKYNLNSPQ
jgi:aryl-alcohol dehydrogenase-like predicted oxidoreductase